jgi:hypothetical protein
MEDYLEENKINNETDDEINDNTNNKINNPEINNKFFDKDDLTSNLYFVDSGVSI